MSKHARLCIIEIQYLLAEVYPRLPVSRFESHFEADVSRPAAVSAGDADGFVSVLDQVINDTLDPDYWAITLPKDLATSAAKSPALLAYIAALNIHDADVLLSTSKGALLARPVDHPQEEHRAAPLRKVVELLRMWVNILNRLSNAD